MKTSKRETAIFVAYDDCEPVDIAVAEKGLLKAVLTTAMNEIQNKGPKARDAVRYFLDPDEEYVFSFHSICTYLNVSPRQILLYTGLLEDPEFMSRYNRINREKRRQFGAIKHSD